MKKSTAATDWPGPMRDLALEKHVASAKPDDLIYIEGINANFAADTIDDEFVYLRHLESGSQVGKVSRSNGSPRVVELPLADLYGICTTWPGEVCVNPSFVGQSCAAPETKMRKSFPPFQWRLLQGLSPSHKIERPTNYCSDTEEAELQLLEDKLRNLNLLPA